MLGYQPSVDSESRISDSESVVLLLENSASVGDAIGWRFQDFADIMVISKINLADVIVAPSRAVEG